MIQTSGGWESLRRRCESTWRVEAEEKGYQILHHNFSGSSLSFVEILLDYLEEYRLDYIGCMFEDLYFDSLELPEAKDISRAMAAHEVEYFRVDGRPPSPRGKEIFCIGGVGYGPVRAQRYCMSTVLGFFSRKALQELIQRGCHSCWDIENLRKPVGFAVAPNARTARYHNIIHRDRIDLVGAFNANATNGVLLPLRRAASRWFKEKLRGL